jgi:hypothetical protein
VLAETATGAGCPEDALRFTGQALELARSGGDAWNEVFALNVRAEALTAVGRLSPAREAAAAALALALALAPADARAADARAADARPADASRA